MARTSWLCCRTSRPPLPLHSSRTRVKGEGTARQRAPGRLHMQLLWVFLTTSSIAGCMEMAACLYTRISYHASLLHASLCIPSIWHVVGARAGGTCKCPRCGSSCPRMLRPAGVGSARTARPPQGPHGQPAHLTNWQSSQPRRRSGSHPEFLLPPPGSRRTVLPYTVCRLLRSRVAQDNGVGVLLFSSSTFTVKRIPLDGKGQPRALPKGPSPVSASMIQTLGRTDGPRAV